MKKLSLFFLCLMIGSGLWAQEEKSATRAKTFLQIAKENSFETIWNDVQSRVNNFTNKLLPEKYEVVPFEMARFRFSLITLRAKIKLPGTTEDIKRNLLETINDSLDYLWGVLTGLYAEYELIQDPVTKSNIDILREIINLLTTVKQELESAIK